MNRNYQKEIAISVAEVNTEHVGLARSEAVLAKKFEYILMSSSKHYTAITK